MLPVPAFCSIKIHLKHRELEEAPPALGHPTQLCSLIYPLHRLAPGDWLGGVSCKQELGGEGTRDCRGTCVFKNSSGPDSAALPHLLGFRAGPFLPSVLGVVLAGILGANALYPLVNKMFFFC